MVVEFGLVDDIDSAGYYAGLIASSFMFARMLTSFLWGQISDDWGRKIVFVTCTLSSVIFPILFGLSNSFWIALFSRFMLGFFGAHIGLAKTMVSEAVSHAYQSQYLGYLLGISNLGSVLGPAIGGLLSITETSPEPTIFMKKISNLIKVDYDRYHFLMPNLIGAIFSLVICILGIIFLPKREKGDTEKEPFLNSPELPQKETKTKLVKYLCPVHEMKYLLSDAGRRSAALSYTFFSFIHLSFTEILALWLQTSEKSQGFGFNSSSTGYVLSIASLFLIFFMVFIFPRFSSSIPSTELLIYSSAILCSIMFLIPEIPHFVAKNEIKSYGFYVIITIVGVVLVLNSCIFVAINAMVNNSCIAQERGAMNGIVMTLGSLSKTIGPFLCAELYAYSLSPKTTYPFDSHLVFYFLGVLLFCLCQYARSIPISLNKNLETKFVAKI